MSLLNLNTANQPITVSGASQLTMSGQVVFIGASGTPKTANVNRYGFDDGSINDNRLLTQAALVAFEQDQGNYARLRVTSSGIANSMSGVQFKLAVAFSGDPVSISGQPVGVSGATVYPVSGKVYNQIYDPSGVQWLDLWSAGSGNHNLAITANVTTNISGQVVYTASGNNAVQLYAFDPSGVALRPLIVNQSGGNVLRVDAGAISVTSNVSGNTVYVVSGKNYNQVFDPSGQQWLDLWSAASGQHRAGVSIGDRNSDFTYAGVFFFKPNSNLDTTDGGLNTLSAVYGWEEQTSGWYGARVTASGKGISGIQHRLVVAFSGDPVSVSGQPVSVSGNLVLISGTIATSVSGNMVSVSGQPVNVSGNVVNTSGNVALEFGTIVRTTSGVRCTAASGGTELYSGIIFSVTIRNSSGNTPIYIGGTSTEAPFSGKGMIMYANESLQFKIDNFNRLRGFATTSGQLVNIIGVANVS